jgi:hypothetical protein
MAFLLSAPTEPVLLTRFYDPAARTASPHRDDVGGRAGLIPRR